MSLLNRFFGKKPNPFANQVLDILKRASEAAKKPRGLGQSAIDGAQTRHHLISLIEKVEAQIGQMAIALAEKEGVLMIHPKLTEEIRKQPDKDILESALTWCFRLLTASAGQTLTGLQPSEAIEGGQMLTTSCEKRPRYWRLSLPVILI